MNASEKTSALPVKETSTNEFSETSSITGTSEYPDKQKVLTDTPRMVYSGDAVKKLFIQNRKWLQKISAAILDQVFFAGSNFIINVLLARWMSAEQYGAFVVAYSWFLLPQGFYEAVLTEPLNVFGAGKYSSKFKTYLGYVFWGHILVSLVIAALLLIGAAVAYKIDSEIVGVAIAGAAITAPFMLTRWLTKAPFYILSKPHLSVFSGMLYLLFCLIGIYFLHFGDVYNSGAVICPSSLVAQSCLLDGNHSLLTPFSALAVMGIAGVLSSIVMTSLLLKPNFKGGDAELTFRKAFVEHWHYGKWAIPYRIMIWIPANIYYILLPFFVSLAESGALRALMNIVLPILMSMNAVTALLLPSFVRTYQKRGKKALDKRVYRAIMGAAALAGLYFFGVVLFGRQIMNIMYDGKYDHLITFPILVTIGLLPSFSAIRVILSAGLRAMGNVKQNFQSTVIPTIFTVTVGIILMASWGILGTNIAQVISAALLMMFLAWYYRNTEGAFESLVQNKDEIAIDSEILPDD